MRAALLARATAAALALLCHTQARAAEGDDYSATFAQAAEQEQRGDFTGAAQTLRPLLPLYPQDNALVLQIAYNLKRAGDYAGAESYYRQALERRLWPEDAYLGLGYTLVAQRRCWQARPYLQAALRLDPLSHEARQGLALCPPDLPLLSTWFLPGLGAPGALKSWHFLPAVTLTGQLFRNSASRTSAVAATASLAVDYRHKWLAQALYRFGDYFTPAGVTPWIQHELHLTAGYSGDALGLGLQYSVVLDGSGFSGTSHHVGLSGRWSALGDLRAFVSGSFYPGGTQSPAYDKIWRAELQWQVPLFWLISARPALAVQWALAPDIREQFITGFLTLSIDHPRGSLWVGGKGGDEFRPAYLDLSVVYNIPERVSGGVFVGGSVNIRNSLRLNLVYSWERWGDGSDAHFMTLGAAKAF